MNHADNGNLSKGDLNKLNSFTADPEKYATGSSRAREKVQYLESIKHKFTGVQVAQYIAARKGYEETLTVKKESKKRSRADYGSILQEAFNTQRSVKIRYKNSWRTIDPYSINEKYIVAYCHFARDIRTFRLDRVQGAELTVPFDLDINLKTISQKKLVEAPSYKGRGHRWR